MTELNVGERGDKVFCGYDREDEQCRCEHECPKRYIYHCVEGLKKKNNETNMDMAQLQKKVRKLQENLNIQLKIVEQKEREKNAFAAKLLQLRVDHEKSKKDLEDAIEQIALLNTEIQSLKSSIASLEDIITAHVKELEKREQQIQEQSNQMKEFLQYQKDKEQKFDKLMKDFEYFKDVNGIFCSYANNMEQTVRDRVEAKQKIRELEEANNMVRNLTEKHKNVEKKLETAISEKNMAVKCQTTAEEEKSVVVKERDTANRIRKGLEAQLEDLPKKKTTGCMHFLCSK